MSAHFPRIVLAAGLVELTLATATPEASGQASAAASGSAAPEKPPRSLEQHPPGDEKTPMPKGDEWQRAEPIALASPLPKHCTAVLLREWLRIRCKPSLAQSSAILSGDGEGIATWLQGPRLVQTGRTAETQPGWADLMLPIRRGDRRIVQLTESFEGYDGPGPQWQLFILSSQWLDDQPGPWVTVAPPLH